jgi:hypothetical protein
MTEQELFDQVVNGLRAQGGKSFGQNPNRPFQIRPMCLYRSATGRKCAAGHVIRDEDYKPEYEGEVIRELLDKGLFPYLNPYRQLIDRLQSIHDKHRPEDWEHCFKEVAKMYNLTYVKPTSEM